MYVCMAACTEPYLEADSGNISDGVTGTTESSDQHLVVLVNEVQATVPWNECSDLLGCMDVQQ